MIIQIFLLLSLDHFTSLVLCVVLFRSFKYKSIKMRFISWLYCIQTANWPCPKLQSHSHCKCNNKSHIKSHKLFLRTLYYASLYLSKQFGSWHNKLNFTLLDTFILTVFLSFLKNLLFWDRECLRMPRQLKKFALRPCIFIISRF